MMVEAMTSDVDGAGGGSVGSGGDELVFLFIYIYFR